MLDKGMQVPQAMLKPEEAQSFRKEGIKTVGQRMRPPYQAPHYQARVYSYAKVKIGEMSE